MLNVCTFNVFFSLLWTEVAVKGLPPKVNAWVLLLLLLLLLLIINSLFIKLLNYTVLTLQ